MSAEHLWRYTPSRTDTETLETILVQREPLLTQLVEIVDQSLASRDKHFVLLVGPRGIGKTHALTVLHHRLGARATATSDLIVAKLEEDPWAITTITHLFRGIGKAIAKQVDDGLKRKLERLPEIDRDAQESFVQEAIEAAIGERTLLILAENLDEIFESIGIVGQRVFRAFLQNFRQCAVIATASSLSTDFKDRDAPFHGFFNVKSLEPLSIESGRELLERIARLRDDAELAHLLSSPLGRERVRALDALVRGNPRLYLIFSEFLAADNLDRLTTPVMKTIDELTPYYQDRMKSISRQQRMIVAHLAECQGSTPVKNIASACLITEQTASAQLRELRGRALVSSLKIGRETYYEIREPLMRLALRVKTHSRRGTELFVDFLRTWYSRGELERRLDGSIGDGERERELVRAALEEIRRRAVDPATHELHAEALAALDDTRCLDALGMAEKLIADRGLATDYRLKGTALLGLCREEEAIEALLMAQNLDPANDLTTVDLGLAQIKADRLDDAESTLSKIDKAGTAYPLAAVGRADVARRRGHFDLALEHYFIARRLDHQASEGVTFLIALILMRLNRHQEAGREYARYFANQPDDSHALLELVKLADDEGSLHEYVSLIETIAADGKLVDDMWWAVGTGYSHLGRHKDALDAFGHAPKHQADARTRFPYVMTLKALGHWDQAIDAIASTLDDSAYLHDRPPSDVFDFVMSLATDDSPPETWQARVHDVVKVFIGAGSAAAVVLSVAVLRTSHRLESLAKESRVLWLETWAEAWATYPQLELSLLLLEVTRTYISCNEKSVLLEVPKAARKIVVDILDLDPTDFGIDPRPDE